MTDTKNNKDILFYVRCLPDKEGLLLEAGKVYGVMKIENNFYKIKTNLNFTGWFETHRFELTIIKEVEENIEKMLA